MIPGVRRGKDRGPAPGIPVAYLLPASCAAPPATDPGIEDRVATLLGRMTVAEKIGQLSLFDGAEGKFPDDLREAIRQGRVGAVLNEVDVETVNAMQRVAVEQSRLGVPLLVGRDVVHGFRTVLPIPLGLAATFNPDVVREGARIAAVEAAAAGINWTFAPMIDVTRDPRWGRIAEGFGEDPYLTAVLAVASVRGFQGDDLSAPGALAACVKHFAAYGAAMAGREYGAANVPERELRDVYLPPFRAAVEAGAASVMASFTEIDGVPATASRFLMTDVLRGEWNFDGFVVSDWASVEELTVHGIAADEREAAALALRAGVNVEMATTTYADHLASLLDEGRVTEAEVDAAAAGVLRIKFRLGLFDSPYTDPSQLPPASGPGHLATARQAALESVVLLQNRKRALPLDRDRLRSLAVVGPLADDPYEQLGTWIFDGDVSISRTPLQAIRELLGDAVEVRHARALRTTRSRSTAGLGDAVAAALAADAVVAFVGEESMLSGEAHSRADIGLPGAQVELIRALAETGKPVIAVVLAGRPLTLGEIVDDVDALLFAWHPGTMGGPAIADLLFGVESPSGKLPVTFPGMVGQIPIHYAHKRTGRPPDPDRFVHADDMPPRMPQTSSGFVSAHIDAGHEPLYPFGHGLSYATFSYDGIEVTPEEVPMGAPVTVRAVVRNDGDVAADEIVQLYVADLVGQVTRPVRELKGFRRVRLQPGERRTVSFELGVHDLAFHGRDLHPVIEPGDFHVWVGGSSRATLRGEFRILDAAIGTPVAFDPAT